MHRRNFFQLCAGAALASPASAPPIRLGFDTYSVRDFRWKALQLLDYGASLKLDTVQISSLGDYESLEPSYLGRIKDHAARLGLVIDAGMGCICPTSKSWSPRNGNPEENILRGLRAARAVGAGAMRCFMGSSADREDGPIERHMEAAIRVFRAVRSRALDLGVKIALENHSGDMQARETRSVIEESGRDAVGACLDNGNAIWALEDPMVTIELLGPYAITTHIRDAVIYEHPRGAAAQWVALGDGSLDLAGFMARYRAICPQAPMQLEIITGRPPRLLPYFESGFWKAFPKARAAEFARFVALAKAGHPFMGSMVIPGAGRPSPEMQAALKEQQRTDLERSLKYAQTTLGVGLRGRT